MTASTPTGQTGPRPMVSSTVRFAVEDFELLKSVAKRTGRSQQDLIGAAIRQVYGDVNESRGL